MFIFFQLKYEVFFMKDLNQYVSQVNELTLNTTENVLKIGLAFYEAKSTLNEKDYSLFLSRTNYSQNSSQVRKFDMIGKNYLKLSSIKKFLPPVISIIYKLSSLDSDLLNQLIKDKKLYPTITTKELDKELNPKIKQQTKLKIVIEFDSQIDSEQISNLIDELNSKYSNQISLMLSKSISNLLNKLQQDQENQSLKQAA